MSSVHIPHFDKKFKYLFSKHPAIKSYTQLADDMHVSLALVSGWKNGTETTHPERIPFRHIGAVCDRLFVNMELLELDDFPQFLRRAGEQPRPSLWDGLVLRAPYSERLQILPGNKVRAQPSLLLAGRGIINPEDVGDVPSFAVNEEVLVRLDASPAQHAVLLQKDRLGWQCLHPTARWPQTLLDGLFLFPPQRDLDRPAYGRFDTVMGPVQLVAVLTKAPLPDALRRGLIDGTDLPDTLHKLAVVIGPDDAKPGIEIVQTRCHVTA